MSPRVGSQTFPGAHTGETFGQALRRLRSERRMSLRALAEHVYFDFGYLGQVERGERAGSADLAKKCDAALESGAFLTGVFHRGNSSDGYGVTQEPTPAHTGWVPSVTSRAEDLDSQELLIPTSQAPDGRIIFVDSSRRGFLQSIGGAAVAAAATPGSASLPVALNEMRSLADTLLDTQSVSSASLDSWEETADYYGALELTAAPEAFLAQVAHDFGRVQSLLSQRQPLRIQRVLYRVMAQFAGLIAIVSNDVGWDAQRWFRTARRAAEEADDNATAAWVLTHQSMTYLWSGKALQKAVQLSQEAQSQSGRSAITSLAAAMEARAQARLGNQAETLAAVSRSEEMFSRLGPADTRINVLGVYEHLLRFFQGNALTVIGKTDMALEVHQRASGLVHSNVVDASLLQVDRATCLMTNGDEDEGCHLAAQALASFPLKSRAELIARRAEEVVRLAHTSAESSRLRRLLDAHGRTDRPALE